MSKWSILKRALTGRSIGAEDSPSSSSSLSIHRHHGFELYSHTELKGVPWQPVSIEVKAGPARLDSSSAVEEKDFQALLQSFLIERDLLVGYLGEIHQDSPPDADKSRCQCDIEWNFSSSFSSPADSTDVSTHSYRFLFSFHNPIRDAHDSATTVVRRSKDNEVSIPLENSNFKSYEISPHVSICTREWKEMSKLSLTERMKGLMSNKLHGIDNTGNVRVWTAEQILLYTLLHPSSTLLATDTVISDATILELGAGLTGLLGLGLAACINHCKSVHITDGHPNCVKNLAVCAKLNEHNCRGKVQTSQLRWAKNDPHGELQAIINSNGGNSFDFIVAADCLFFTDFHEDLAWVLDRALSSSSHAKIYLLQPTRSGSMQKFLNVAEHYFDITFHKDYCADITALHHRYMEQSVGTYDEDIHYPILIMMTKKKQRLSITNKMLYNPDVMRLLLSFLSPCDLISMCSVAKGQGIGPLMMQDREVDDLFREHIQRDFNINRYANTRQTNLPPGYYRKLYLDILEERLMEENLITGGH